MNPWTWNVRVEVDTTMIYIVFFGIAILLIGIIAWEVSDYRRARRWSREDDLLFQRELISR